MATSKSKSADANADAAAESVALPELEKANEQGFIGQKVDPTPNENYTVAGVTAGKPTPETDEASAAAAHKAAREAGPVDQSADTADADR